MTQTGWGRCKQRNTEFFDGRVVSLGRQDRVILHPSTISFFSIEEHHFENSDSHSLGFEETQLKKNVPIEEECPRVILKFERCQPLRALPLFNFCQNLTYFCRLL
jgi:hypothetical protein